MLVALAVLSYASGCHSDDKNDIASPVDPGSPPGTLTGPLRKSARNPRYFADASGRIVYLTGSHVWPNLQDGGTTDPPAAFRWGHYLDMLETHHMNFMKLWRWEQAKYSAEAAGDFFLTPNAYQRTGPGNALDGKPKFDVTKFNEAYFDRMRERVIEAGRRGIYVAIMLYDGWSIEAKHPGTANPWLGHPFNAANNINGIDGDPDGDDAGVETQTMQIPGIVALHEAYARKVIDKVNDLDNVLYEITNEDRGGIDAEAWQYHMIDFIHAYERQKPKQHPVGMTALFPGGDNADLFASNADWIAPNGDADDPPAATGDKVIINDTDHLCGTCLGRPSWAWKSLTRGVNPVLMDPFDGSWGQTLSGPYDVHDPRWEQTRRAMQFARDLAFRANLAEMAPHGELASTGYCLAKPTSSGAEYIVYLPDGGSVSVDLSATAATLTVEWINAGTGAKVSGGTVAGGDTHEFTAPFSGHAALYIH